jgi:hypothetical protein
VCIIFKWLYRPMHVITMIVKCTNWWFYIKSIILYYYLVVIIFIHFHIHIYTCNISADADRYNFKFFCNKMSNDIQIYNDVLCVRKYITVICITYTSAKLIIKSHTKYGGIWLFTYATISPDLMICLTSSYSWRLNMQYIYIYIYIINKDKK